MAKGKGTNDFRARFEAALKQCLEKPIWGIHAEIRRTLVVTADAVEEATGGRLVDWVMGADRRVEVGLVACNRNWEHRVTTWLDTTGGDYPLSAFVDGKRRTASGPSEVEELVIRALLGGDAAGRILDLGRQAARAQAAGRPS